MMTRAEQKMPEFTDSSKGKWLKETFYEYLPFMVLGLVMFVFFYTVLPAHDDVQWRVDYQTGISVFDWLTNRYYHWSSRLLIDFVMFFLCGMPMLVWRFLNAIVFALLGISLARLIAPHNVRLNWLICLLLISYCTIDIFSAGYITTSLNYTWPALFGLLSLSPARKLLQGGKASLCDYLLCIPACLFAANHEMMALFLVLLNLALLLWVSLPRKKLEPFFLVMTLIALAELIWELQCPGNHERAVSSAGFWFPGHDRLSLIHKLEIGYSTGLAQFLSPNFLLLSLFGTTAYLVWRKYDGAFYRFISALPFCVTLIFGFLSPVLSPVYPAIANMASAAGKYGLMYVDNAEWFLGIFSFLLITLVLLCYVVSVLASWPTDQAALLLVIFISGLLTRVAAAFSPSINEGMERISSFLFLAVLFLTARNFYAIDTQENRKTSDLMLYICGIFSLIGYFSLF